MKLVTIPEFRQRTAPLSDQEWDFAGLDITPDDCLGFFEAPRLNELIFFCKRNPKFHIISYLKSSCVRVNSVIEAAAFYRLGQGDKDPELMCIPPISDEAVDELRILEFEAD